MTVRIAEIHRALKPTGSFYLHCDPTASHYLKLCCDALFVTRGGEYQNEVIWKRTGSHGGAKRFGPIHDIIFFYTKSNSFTWNRVFEGYKEEYLEPV
jgi:site-specific DNA-methyltransferase (adenine-specific)